jgi:hypothetical protein
MKNETISHKLTFGWRWDNIEAVIEYLEVIPDQETTLIAVTAERLKEGGIEAFGRLFARKPLDRLLTEATEVDYLPGVSAFYNVLGAPKTDGIHEPISRVLRLHSDSDTSIHHIGVTFAMAMRHRLTGPLLSYDFDAIKSKYSA